MSALDSEHLAQNPFSINSIAGPWPIQLPLSQKTRDADDELLIHLITAGSKTDSQAALETVFVRHHKDVWRYVRSRVTSATDADEISASVWLVVIEKIYDFVWTGVPIKSWLLNIAHKKVLEFVNSPPALSLEQLDEAQDEALQFIASQLHLSDEIEPMSQVSQGIKKEADEILHKMIARLPAIERQIVMLIYFEELETATQVANRLDMNKNTIRVYHKRARDRLRQSPELRRLLKGRPKNE